MRRVFNNLLNLLGPGVRGLLGLLALAYLAAAVGRGTNSFDLGSWMALRPAEVLQGRVWQMVTYPLVSANGLEFIINAVVIAWLGAMLEREWRRGQLWVFCVVAALGAGLVKLALCQFSPGPMMGTASIVFGLFAAWAKNCGHERVLVPGLGEISARWCALGLAAISFLLMLAQAGWLESLLPLGGGLAGWLFLSLRRRQLYAQPARAVPNERVRRLEI